MKLRPLSVAALCVAVLAVVLKSRLDSKGLPETAVNLHADSRTPAEFCRAPSNTYLTYPEWYLVYSPREYANFIAEKPPSHFPFLGHVKQFWQGYQAIYAKTKDDKPFNTEYHVMIYVIGASTTAEYGLKWAYELLVGRATELTRGSELTDEDRLANDVARQYVDFLDIEPWYNFDFLTPLKRVWTETSWWGAHPLRKWERKYFLTSECLVKAAYGWALKKTSESSYGVESPFTYVILGHAPPASLSDVKVIETFSDGAVLAQLPRYQAFTRVASALAKEDVGFLEIAGNTGPILVTVVVNEDFEPKDVEVVFEQSIMTEPGLKRIAFTVPVPHLSSILRKLARSKIDIEHIYDF